MILLQQESEQKCCESICETVLGKEGDWKTGKTKIFLKVLPHIFMLSLLPVMDMCGRHTSQNYLNFICSWIPIELWNITTAEYLMLNFLYQ